MGFGRWDRSSSGGAYLVPSFACSLRIVSSSSGVHAPFLRDGSRLLHQRSRHCLPVRPGSMDAIRAQCLPPYWPTSSTSCSSSLALHGPAQATAQEGRQARTHGRAVRGLAGRAVRGLASRRPRPGTVGAVPSNLGGVSALSFKPCEDKAGVDARTRACAARRLTGCARPMRRMGAGARAPPPG